MQHMVLKNNKIEGKYMAQFGINTIAEGLEDAVYRSGFGDMPNKTIYKYYLAKPQDEVKNIDFVKDAFERKNMDRLEVKALTTTGNLFATGTNYTSTSGSVPTLIPIYLDPEITDITKYDTPMYNGLIKKVTNRGLYADYVKMTAKGAAAFKAEDAALPEADDTYTRAVTAIKFAYATGRITGPMLAASAEFQNMLRIETVNKHQTLAELLEKQICQGTTGGDSGGFSGFLNIVTTNYANLSSTTVTVAALRTAIRTCRQPTTARGLGHPDLMVTDWKTVDDIKALMQNELRYYNLPEGRIAWGIRAVEFEGIPIICSGGMPTTTNGKEIHVYDTTTWEMRILKDETFEELAKTNDSYKFMISWYGTLICKNELYNYRIYGGV